jgi:DNA modification methylase
MASFYEDVTDINFALVEATRPPMYKGLKYWGKKPHNIWSQYIETYCAPGDIVLDIFSGSGVCALEALQIGRRAISIDLNPMSEYVVDFLTTPWDEEDFLVEAERIYQDCLSYCQGLNQYVTTCRKCSSQAQVINYKWENGTIYEVCYSCEVCRDNLIYPPNSFDLEAADAMEGIQINEWFPTRELPTTSAVTSSFRKQTNNLYSNIWTRRNLALISRIFSQIEALPVGPTRTALLFAFTSSIHLCSRMCVPRRAEANRPFSTSWGRSAFIMAKRQMEMNPLVTFNRSCVQKQGVLSVKRSALAKLEGKVKRARNVDEFFKDPTFNLLVLTMDAADVSKVLPPHSVDFVLTDPPYGGLVQYLALSSVWTVWLEKIYPTFNLDFQSELTIDDKKTFDDYHRMLSRILVETRKVLRPKRKMIVTFHNDQVNIWNSLLRSTDEAGFQMEKIIYQPNKRTGESNVANPYGTSASDFYLRFIKRDEQTSASFNLDQGISSDYRSVIINAAKSVIVARGEPTDEAFLLNGIYIELAKHGHFLEANLVNIQAVLSNEIPRTFTVFPQDDPFLGGKWWISQKVQNLPLIPLSDRVETAIIQTLRRKGVATYDEILADIFKAFPNGLTPAVKDVRAILNEYAIQVPAKKAWSLKPNFNKNETLHSTYIGILASYASVGGGSVWIGTREQGDQYEGDKLQKLVTPGINFDDFNSDARKRIEMIDLVILDNSGIRMIVEVENSTSITSALERASHIVSPIERFIVIPDERVGFMGRKLKEPLFKDYYDKGNWKTLTYSAVDEVSRDWASNHNLDLETLIRGMIDAKLAI